MRFQELPLRCECGLVPGRIKRVGLTARHQLAIHWRCSGCRREVYVVKDLADCWRECPKSDEEQKVCATVELGEPDAQFLRSLGVRFPDAEQS